MSTISLFNTQGANPLANAPTNTANPFSNAPTNTANPFSNAPSNPVANALNNKQAPNMSTVNGPVYAPPPTMPSAPTNQSVVSHSVTDAAGNTTKQTYAPSTTSGALQPNTVNGITSPTALTSQPAPTVNNASTGGLLYNGVATSGAPGTVGNQGGVTQNNSTPNSQNGVQAGGTGGNLPTSTGSFTTPSGAVVDSNGNLISAPPSTPFSTAVTGLLNSPNANAQIGQTAQGIANAAGKQITAVNTEAAGLENAYGTTPGMAFPTSQGLAQAAASTAGQVTQGIAAGANMQLAGTGQALTAQGQSQSGLNSAGQLAAPVMQAGMLTNPINGQPLNPSLVANAVQDATKLVQNGASVNDPQVQALLNPFGYYGASAFTQAQEALSSGSYNPTNQSAIAAANASTGTQLGTQGALLQPSLTGLTQTGQQIQSLLSSGASNGLNALAPNWANTAIQTLQSTLGNNANVVSLTGMVNDAQGYISQILQSQDGMTPSAATSASAALNLQNLSPNALSTVLSNISNLGQIRLGTYQQGASGALGGSASQLYQGGTSQVNPNASVNADTSAISSQPPIAQAAEGIGLGAIQGIVDFVQGLFGTAGSAAVSGIAGGTAAAAEGKAATVLGL